MQFNAKSILASTLVSLATFAATSAPASDAPLTCITDGLANWRVAAVGPVTTTCGGEDCTAISYTITPLKGLVPDHVVVLAEHDMDIVEPGARNVFAPCIGDNVTFIGIHDCSTKAARVNKNAEKGTFDLVVKGLKALVGSSIVIKKGNRVERCRIASLGTDNFNEHAERITNTEFNFKGCIVNIPTDPVTGEGGAATITGGPRCKFVANGDPVDVAELFVNGKSVGPAKFGEGYLSTGDDSCTSRVIGLKLYTLCTCAPADPNPPCTN